MLFIGKKIERKFLSYLFTKTFTLVRQNLRCNEKYKSDGLLKTRPIFVSNVKTSFRVEEKSTLIGEFFLRTAFAFQSQKNHVFSICLL